MSECSFEKIIAVYYKHSIKQVTHVKAEAEPVFVVPIRKLSCKCTCNVEAFSDTVGKDNEWIIKVASDNCIKSIFSDSFNLVALPCHIGDPHP